MLTCPVDVGIGYMLEFSRTKGEVYRQVTFFTQFFGCSRHSWKAGNRWWVRFSYFFM